VRDAAVASDIALVLGGDAEVAQHGLIHRHCVHLVLTLVTAVSAAPVSGSPAYSFDAADHYLTRATDYPRWADLTARHVTQLRTIESCLRDATTCPQRMHGYREIVVRAHDLTASRKMVLINRFINTRHWRIEDRRDDDWRTLVDFLSRGGDCEDYAIAKYFALRQVGFSAADVRVGITRDPGTHTYHAVTIVRIDDQIYFLDVDGAPRRSQAGYRFLFSINEFAIWDHATRVRKSEEDRS
jgi:predicted transglutaminase-like cysteine proteinase